MYSMCYGPRMKISVYGWWLSRVYVVYQITKLIHLNVKHHREFPDTSPLRMHSNPGNAKLPPKAAIPGVISNRHCTNFNGL